MQMPFILLATKKTTQMTKLLKIGFLCLIFKTNIAFAQRCATPKRDSLMAIKYKNWVFQRRALEDSIASFLNNKRPNGRVGAVCLPLRIPVVVHVVHDNTANNIGGAGNANIADTQILNQIRILNEDYRRKAGTKGFNNNPIGADTGIEFYLAKTDPDGNSSTGITRHLYTDKRSFDIFSDETILVNIVSWPSDRYLNIWVVKSLSSAFLGVAQFPSVSGIGGLDTSGDLQDKTDGVIIDYRTFGIGATVSSRLYNLGRTATHEIGHWLGLLHTWGDANCGDDFCADTPVCQGGNQSNNCGPFFSNCTGTRTRNMTENYMDYSPDSCMNVFTKNQTERIQAVLEKSPRRAKLLRLACTQLAFGTNLDVTVYPNPADINLNIKVIMKQIGNINMQFYGLTGQLVQQYNFENYPSWIFDLPTANLANGEYILKISTQDESTIKRIVVIR